MSKPLDNDIEEMNLDEIEKHLLQLHRNYTKAFQRKRAASVDKASLSIGFDLESFEAHLIEIEDSDPARAILIGVAVADQLLADMYKRSDRQRLDVKNLLGALGPLGDFSKRLKVAALAEFVDENDLVFFDELRKMRNRIAHSTSPSPPTPVEIERLIKSAPEWLDALIEAGKISEKQVRSSPAILKAAIQVHLAKLAWGTILRPMCLKADVPLSIMLEHRPEILSRLSTIGILRAVKFLERS